MVAARPSSRSSATHRTKLRSPNHDIAEQAGWSESSVEQMVTTYAHTGMGALDRIRAAASIDALPDIRDANRDAQTPQSRA